MCSGPGLDGSGCCPGESDQGCGCGQPTERFSKVNNGCCRTDGSPDDSRDAFALYTHIPDKATCEGLCGDAETPCAGFEWVVDGGRCELYASDTSFNAAAGAVMQDTIHRCATAKCFSRCNLK